MKSFKDYMTERCWPGYKPAPGKKAYAKGSCVKEEVEKIFNAYKTYNYTQFYNEASNCESFAEEWMINYIQKLLKINTELIQHK